MRHSWLWSLVFLAARSPAAHAYSANTLLSEPCHEDMTFAALLAVREELGLEVAHDESQDERALIDDVPFPVPEEARDLAAVSLVLGNRNNDFGDQEPDDLNQLALVHGNPENQHQHCLRRPEQDGFEGSKAALDECRAYILGHVEAALEHLRPDGSVALDERIELPVALDVRGPVAADLPAFYVEMGHALHAVQDGFSHTYRTRDHLRVVSVLD